ncbi:N-succinylarginine dihydrolase [Sandaracinobacter sp. RS1-74]|uniref:N-succinylarginine dihydrolase n=1 Tax=Sandaracinobacteroides sayramensis TaxID=2913411 RepID=UPI001EDA51E2|nr:N-succinylarginine dihydrolase [Sandaracinobacteroides sayramensis]MCG2840717.1 N-succinylarginine dihydrolase [Sandaracinobacteroides sayramensis]
MPELQLDGLVGPSHNYAGLSLGNVAATLNAGATSAPRKAALQGLSKMRLVLSLGLPQGLLLPHRRPNTLWLRGLGFEGADAEVLAACAADDPQLLAAASSASAMWTANAATVSPAADTADGLTHLTVANLVSMPHRSQEWPETLAQLRLAFADSRHFAVHWPVAPGFGDEGAANHMRFAPSPAAEGVEVFVYGVGRGGAFPARQHPRASQAVARAHGVKKALFVEQADAAIQAGAFHNDVVAVSNGTLLFAHEEAFADRGATLAALEARVPGFQLVEASSADVPLADAISAYLFNAALLTVEDGIALILPKEAEETETVWRWLQRVRQDGSNPINHLHVMDLRESMKNGGGPACLRLRVPLSEEALAAVDPRFLLDERRLDRLERLVEAHWPQAIAPADLSDPELQAQCAAAHRALLAELAIRPEELGF